LLIVKPAIGTLQGRSSGWGVTPQAAITVYNDR
jgi:hypothetical protein